jgi:hypothetical protein
VRVDLHEKALVRFWSKVDKTEGLGPEGTCWEWAAGKTKRGYGRFLYNRKHIYSHRFLFLYYLNDLRGLKILHHCDNPPCCNPDHLFVGTQKDNMDDMISKNRGKGRDRTHCKYGHDLTEENIAFYARRRLCRICIRRSNREKYWRKKETCENS